MGAGASLVLWFHSHYCPECSSLHLKREAFEPLELHSMSFRIQRGPCLPRAPLQLRREPIHRFVSWKKSCAVCRSHVATDMGMSVLAAPGDGRDWIIPIFPARPAHGREQMQFPTPFLGYEQSKNAGWRGHRTTFLCRKVSNYVQKHVFAGEWSGEEMECGVRNAECGVGEWLYSLVNIGVSVASKWFERIDLSSDCDGRKKGCLGHYKKSIFRPRQKHAFFALFQNRPQTSIAINKD